MPSLLSCHHYYRTITIIMPSLLSCHHYYHDISIIIPPSLSPHTRACTPNTLYALSSLFSLLPHSISLTHFRSLSPFHHLNVLHHIISIQLNAHTLSPPLPRPRALSLSSICFCVSLSLTHVVVNKMSLDNIVNNFSSSLSIYTIVVVYSLTFTSVLYR